MLVKWIHHHFYSKRGTPSDDTGPYSAKDGSFYAYTEASGGSTGDEGVMEISLANFNLSKHTIFFFISTYHKQVWLSTFFLANNVSKYNNL